MAPLNTVALRMAVAADMPRVFGMLLAGQREVKPFVPNEDKAWSFLTEHVFARGVILVTESEGEIVGTCGMLAETIWWSDQHVIEGLWLYVDPEHRRTPHATTMLRAMVRYADRVQLPLSIGFAARHGREATTNAKRRLYERVLGPVTGMAFMHAPEGT
jgi:GNAT superfamily N-acetyltransferase